LPNLQIIDIGYGYVGSAHDSTAWKKTYFAEHLDEILAPDEWIWADSAYPVSRSHDEYGLLLTYLQISDWIVAPYKAPECYLPNNKAFNEKVSSLRIRSEHAIGFLKGRFQSLKGLRVRINDKKTHKYATYWIAACVAVHNFALCCKAEERTEDQAIEDNPFFRECIDDSEDEDSSSSSEDKRPLDACTFMTQGRLSRGKERCESLKTAMLRAVEQRRERRRRRCAGSQ
jgi:hypothetical protein